MNITDARRISDALLTHDKIPVGEATELPFEEGWKQWDLATKLNEGNHQWPIQQTGSTAPGRSSPKI